MGICLSRKSPLDGLVSSPPEPDPAELAAGRTPVVVHIYDLLVLNYTTSSIGVGVYHTGVQVYHDGAQPCDMPFHSPLGPRLMHLVVTQMSQWGGGADALLLHCFDGMHVCAV